MCSFRETLLGLDRQVVRLQADDWAKRLSAVTFVETVMVPTLESIGKDWEAGTVSLAEIYMTSRICEELVEHLFVQHQTPRVLNPRLGIAVLLDHHILGKRIVASIVRSAGFELIDYGSQSPRELAQKAAADGVQILMVSTLMLASALKVADLRHELDLTGTPVRLLVGGAPFRFDPNLWREVGADAMAYNASEAPALIHHWAKEAANS
jgi:methylmalonyl-CoA mutase cobalamin-binding domain/chain